MPGPNNCLSRMNCGINSNAAVINEGGLGVRDALFDGQDVQNLGRRKRVLWFEFTRQGLQDTGPSPKGEARIRYVRSCRHFQRKIRPKFSPSCSICYAGRQAQKGTYWRVAQSAYPLVGTTKFMKRGPTHDYQHSASHRNGRWTNPMSCRPVGGFNTIVDCFRHDGRNTSINSNTGRHR